MAVLVTGANSGLGYEACRQLVVGFGVPKIYLGCRNETKARAAIERLVEETGKPQSTFEFVQIDTTNLELCRAAPSTINGKLTGVILNAGGAGGAAISHTKSGATKIFAMNVLGHAALVEALIEQDKLLEGARVMFAGSEMARGLPAFGMQASVYDESDLVGDFVKRIDGSGYEVYDGNVAYGDCKNIGALYMAYMAEEYKQYCFITMSPGATSGTAGFDDEPWYTRLMMNTIGAAMFMHDTPTGTLRYMAALGVSNAHTVKASDSGKFFASVGNTARGPIEDQGETYPVYQDKNAHAAGYEAVHRFLA